MVNVKDCSILVQIRFQAATKARIIIEPHEKTNNLISEQV